MVKATGFLYGFTIARKMEASQLTYLFSVILIFGQSFGQTEDETTTISTTRSKPVTPALPNCTEKLLPIFEVEGDYESRPVLDCNHLGITDATLELILRRLRPNVFALTLADNFLKTINVNQFRVFRNLELLNVSDNKITEVIGRPRDWPAPLGVIDYSGNKLRSVTPPMVPVRARRLYFTNNGIDFIVNGTFSVEGKMGSNLVLLDLSHNRMKTIFDSKIGILDAPQLRVLNLSHNSLSSYFSDERKPMVAFSKLENLEILDLSYNDIDRIFAGDMQYLGNLRYLNLSHNDLPDLDAFSFNALSLKKNGNPYMWQHWAYRWWLLPGPGLRSIRNLDVSHNHIRAIDLQLVHEFGKLETVDLSNNWYNCDGELFFATSIMKKHIFVNSTFVNINSPDHYTCFTPLELAGQHIYNFNCSGFCLQMFNELQRRFDAQRGFPVDDEDMTGPSIAMIVAASIFVIISVLAFLWALRNGLIHRCCHVCLTRMSTSPPRNSRMANTNTTSMTARFAQLDQLEAETEVA